MKAFREAAVGELLSTATEDSIVHLAGGDTLHVSAATLEFYRARAWQSAWVGRKRLRKEGSALHQVVGRAWEDGLPPERYRHDVALGVLSRVQGKGDPPLSDSMVILHMAHLDVLLTEGFNRLARDLALGMLDPEEAGLDQRIQGDEPPGRMLLSRVTAGEKPADLVQELRPSMPQYQRMRTALVAYHEADLRGDWPQVKADSTLQRNDRGESVAQLRQRLSQGLDPQEAELARVGASDPTFFDAELERAVQRFQGRHAIEADGVVGTATFKELNHTITEWIAELRFNLDRWRWLPHSLGDRYVLVNIAGFEMEVVDEGRIIEAMNVVVGQLDLATPLFADSIRHVVVNPYWNVPDGIMERTIRPAIAADPDYLVKHDMEYFDGRVRQRPGPQNSLGRFKFIFPNEFDVYLHDTPDGHLFARTERAFSSGCVRIERPQDFARLLLELQSGQNPDSLDALLATGRETWLKLDRPLPVFLLYFTAWAQEDGTVRFHHDVYGRTEAMDEQAEEMVSTPVPIA
ncbi:MAG: L,D-transpeptidase family protein [Gemmatimonadota bacterium]